MAVKQIIKKMKGKWTPFDHALRFIEVLCIAIGLLSLAYASSQVAIGLKNLQATTEQLKQIKNTESANMMFTFESKLYTGTNNEIFLAIDNNQPLLIENGGNFTSTQLNNYLEDVREEKLIDTMLLYDDFDDAAVKTWNNNEIQTYLKTIRTKEPEYFGGFDQLVNFLKQEN